MAVVETVSSSLLSFVQSEKDIELQRIFNFQSNDTSKETAAKAKNGKGPEKNPPAERMAEIEQKKTANVSKVPLPKQTRIDKISTETFPEARKKAYQPVNDQNKVNLLNHVEKIFQN